jgi:poly [ADP-ribose] polymerase
LWHGSRFSNFVGILSQGLRIAPPEAPRTGYLYGKGVYFATMAGKSAPYCCPEISKNIGLFLLCEVEVGKPKIYYNTCENADLNLPKDCNSSMCVGYTTPDPKDFMMLDKSIRVPFGKKSQNTDKNALRSHDEIIIYNTK